MWSAFCNFAWRPSPLISKPSKGSDQILQHAKENLLSDLAQQSCLKYVFQIIQLAKENLYYDPAQPIVWSSPTYSLI